MSRGKWLMAVVLFVFTALNVYALAQVGFGGLVTWAERLEPWGVVFTADLCISLGLAITWMWTDARRRGRSALPYALLTVATGSIGPLLHLLRRSVPEGGKP